MSDFDWISYCLQCKLLQHVSGEEEARHVQGQSDCGWQSWPGAQSSVIETHWYLETMMHPHWRFIQCFRSFTLLNHQRLIKYHISFSSSFLCLLMIHCILMLWNSDMSPLTIHYKLQSNECIVSKYTFKSLIKLGKKTYIEFLYIEKSNYNYKMPLKRK